MKQSLGNVEYDIELVDPNLIFISIIEDGKIHDYFIKNARENELVTLSNQLLILIHATPTNVMIARKLNVCRICGEDIHLEKEITMNYGREFAHTKCINE